MLKHESHTDRSWIACMTDAVFLEKPQYHGLVIDLTSHAPTERRATARPGLQRDQGAVCAQADIPLLHVHDPRVQHRSSLNLGKWSELDRILQFNADPNGAPRLFWRCTGDLLRLFEVYKTSGALHFTVCVVGLPNVGKGGLINTLEHVRDSEKVHSVASQVAGRMKEPRSVQLEHVLQIVDPLGYHRYRGKGTQGKKWSNRKIPTTLPPTVRSVLFFPSRLRSKHVAEILAHLRAEEPMKIYPPPVSNTTPEFTKTLAFISSMPVYFQSSFLFLLLVTSLVYTGVFVNLELRCPETKEAALS
ncbi:hypothetical protein EDB86DRAFT_3212363 [Lactarius hatsudake]|nr:hypothetical protein EDB86DRAFT_3212363 [Lactarius hatsudake]